MVFDENAALSFLPDEIWGNAARYALDPLIHLLQLVRFAADISAQEFYLNLGATQKIIWRGEIRDITLIGGKVKMRSCFTTALWKLQVW